MRYLSVCSGIEAATVAWHPLGWTPVAFSEVEKFPSAVLAHHYPTVPNWGDMTKFEEWPDESIDLLVGGTPCQSFSVAGLRKGLGDPRGNLMLTFGAIAKRYRPKWLVWENVPGVLSSNGGRDFGTFLGMLAELGYGFAYRVLDAQYFGVAQRRRRVFVVANSRGWQRAAAVLFESHSLQGHPPPRREARQGFARGVEGSTTSGGFRMTAFGQYADDGTASTMKMRDYKDATDLVAQPATFSTPAIGNIREDDIASTVTRNSGAGGETQNPAFVMQPVAFHPTQDPISSEDGTTHAMGCGSKHRTATVAVVQPVAFTRCDNGQDAAVDVTPTMRCGSNYSAHLAVAQAVAVGTDCYNGAITGDVAATLGTGSGTGVAAGPSVMQPVAFPIDTQNMTEGHASGGLGFGQENDPSFTLTKGHSHAVAEVKQVQWASGGGQIENDTAQALRAGAEYNYQFARVAMQVRRLTPTECERLQGFPDNHTNIPWRGKPEAPDGPRYKALGNSMAVPCMEWIGKRIAMVDAL